MIAILSNRRLPWWFLVMTGCWASWTKYVEEYDSMRVARCDAKCNNIHDRAEQCMDNCLTSNYTKPGYCPNQKIMSMFEAACIVACSNDSQCPDLAKCCNNDCGVTCMRPTGFVDTLDNHVPPIPDSIEIRREKSNLVMLSWKIGSTRKTNEETTNNEESKIRYLVEERHVLGPRYSESRLSSWSVRHVSNKPRATLRTGLKNGHWYQFRVAAVNEIGSRGYSSPSGPFKTSEPRNPREPRNLSLAGARVHADGKVGILLRWRSPQSDVPIIFYKLFWSRLIHGPTNDSILVYHRNIPKDKTCYEVKNLDLGCQYFLQVQAVAVYGGRRLASRKASRVFNTTDHEKYADGNGRSRRCDKRNGQLRVRRLICRCDDKIEARLVWPNDSAANRYNVTWSRDYCEKFLGDDEQRRTLESRLTQKTRQDLKGLTINCTYTVNVTSLGSIRESDKNSIWTQQRKMRIEFVTNDCKKRRTQDNVEITDLSLDASSRCRKRKSRIKS